MLTQQQIEALLQASSKHRSATKDEIKLLKRFLEDNAFNLPSINHVKVITETENGISFSFGQEHNKNYFITVPKSETKAEEF